MQYDLIVVTPQGQRIHLGNALRGLSWEEPEGELSVRLEAEIQNQQTPQGWLHQLLPLAGRVQLLADWGQGWQEVFRGTIFGHQYRTDPLGHLTITAYDALIYLMKSKDDRFYVAGTTARAIITDIATAWGVPLGTVEGPDTALAKQVFRARHLGDIINDVLGQVRRRGGGRWVVRSRADAIDVIRPGQNTPVYRFRADENVDYVEDSQDIEDLVTRVRVVGAEDGAGRMPTVAVLDGRAEFGVLQELVYSQQYETDAAAKGAAQEILDERGKPRHRIRLQVPDLPFLRRGDRVSVAAGTVIGQYLVAGVQHDADAKTMLLGLEVA